MYKLGTTQCKPDNEYQLPRLVYCSHYAFRIAIATRQLWKFPAIR